MVLHEPFRSITNLSSCYQIGMWLYLHDRLVCFSRTKYAIHKLGNAFYPAARSNWRLIGGEAVYWCPSNWTRSNERKKRPGTDWTFWASQLQFASRPSGLSPVAAGLVGWATSETSGNETEQARTWSKGLKKGPNPLPCAIPYPGL